MKKALVVLSGGQDSATCAAWANTMFDDWEAISFDYGQKHLKEMMSANAICQLFGNKKKTTKNIKDLLMSPFSALTNHDLSVNDVDKKTGLPKSFVPCRNLMFLTAAASFAMSRGIYDLVTGVCQTDYSGYPDCRRETIDALEKSLRLGNQEILAANNVVFHIHTPMMYLTKAETVLLANRLPKGLEAVGLSWTCYEGGERPCGVCPACKLRAKGFAEAKFPDPALSK